MKLLFVDSSRAKWGTERHFVDLVTALRAAGQELQVVCRRNSGVDELLEARGVPRHATGFRGGGDPRGLWKVVQVVRNFAPDWIITSRAKLYWPVVSIGLALGVRVALFRHMPYLKHWHQRQLLPRLADRFYVVSEFGREVLGREGVPTERLLPLYNPIDVTRFRPMESGEREAMRAKLGFTSEHVVAGFAGRMDLGKGLRPLQAAMTLAMKRVPSLRMLWIGDGPQRAATERAVARSGCGDRQCFVGAQPVIESYLGALDFLVAPSLVSETFGRVVAEAQACGVPVVASRLGGMTEAFMPGESGVLVESPSDAVALSNAIEQMALDPAQRARMGTVGAEFVLTHFSADHIASAFLASLAQCAPLTTIERRLATPFRQTAAGNG